MKASRWDIHQRDLTYQTDRFAEDGASGKGIQDGDSRLKRSHNSAVVSPEFIEALCLFLKKSSD